MAATYEPIATTSPNGVSSYSFTSIPATYTDLRLVIVSVTNTGGSGVTVQLNSDSGTNYSQTDIYGDGSTAVSNRATNEDRWYLSGVTGEGVTSTPALHTLDIFNYAGSTFKTGLITASNDKNGSGKVGRRVSLWRSTSAITSITVFTSGTVTGTTATLYGILKA